MNTTRRPSRRSGSAAIVAVALILLVGFLGSALVTAVRVSGSGFAQDIRGVQARYLALSAVEWNCCDQNTGTTSPLALGNGTFTATLNSGTWYTTGTVGDATCGVHYDPDPNADPVIEGLDYILDARVGSRDNYAEFLMINTSSSSLTFNKMTITWSSPTAYFEKLDVEILSGTDYNTVWNYSSSGNSRWGSGETRTFTSGSVTIPAHYTASITMEKFETNKTGSGGTNKDMDDTTFTIRCYNGSTLVGEFAVGLPPP